MALATIMVVIACLSRAVNEPPNILGLPADAGTVAAGCTCVFTCSPSDADVDTLTYSWTEDGWSIEGSSSTLEWTPPDEKGTYLIGVGVSHGKGGWCSEQRQVIVDVSAEPTSTVAATPEPTPTPTLAHVRSEVDPGIILLLGVVISGLVVAINGVVEMFGQWMKVKVTFPP